jgi:hypothetical protein
MPPQKSVGEVSKPSVMIAVEKIPAKASAATARGERSRKASNSNSAMAQSVIRISGAK